MFRPYHDREILQAEADVARSILAEIDVRGALSSQDFDDRHRYSDDTWNGQTRAGRVLRALWACGDIVTHHRKNGLHYYDRPARVIPSQHYEQPPLLDKEAYARWIIGQRYRAVGLLRPNSEACIWSACGDGPTRKRAIAQLVEEGTLTPVHVGEKGWLYYIHKDALPLLDAELLDPRVIFLGPLDNILWDRKAVQQLFDFDYIWEVYKPALQRRWGYYVLPVFYGDRFIGRLDSRLEKGIWTIARWWWEPEIVPDGEMLDALRGATASFLYYLQADGVQVHESVDAAVRTAMLDGVRLEA